jgi:hypothetical protein
MPYYVVGVGGVRVMLTILRRRPQDQDAQLLQWNRLHRVGDRASGLQHAVMSNVVGVGGVRVMLPILRRRLQDQDAQLHRWNRLHRGAHRASGVQHGSMPGKYVLQNGRW